MSEGRVSPMPELVHVCILCRSLDYAEDRRAAFYLNLPEPYTVVQCSGCGLRWLNPRPTDEEYDEIYTQVYYSNHLENTPESEWGRLFPPPPEDYENETVPYRRVAWEGRLARLESLLPAKGSMLDVGAGTGDFLALARERGWTVTGTEKSEYACRRAREKYGLDLESAGMDNLERSGRQFDVVHLSHVFEHFTHPAESLVRLRSLMQSSSVLVIEVPNQFRSWVQVVRDWRDGTRQRVRSLWSIHHPYFYGRPQLCRLLAQSGFEVLAVRTYFPERWEGSWPKRIGGVVEHIGDRLGGHGDNIEAIARLEVH